MQLKFRKRLKISLKRIIGLILPRWPMPSYDEGNEPHFFFLITPPYSGSTAIAKVLDSSPETITIQKDGEGQWLLLGLSDEERWLERKEVDYASVKAVWLNKYQMLSRGRHNLKVVIEKSPPNMMRIDDLANLFSSCSFLANNRNPYAICASMLYRDYISSSSSRNKGLKVVKELAQEWVSRSYKIKEIIEDKRVPLITYEQFCENPASILPLIDLPDSVLKTIDISTKVKVKDYQEQNISNQNERQIAKLHPDEVVYISDVLKPHSKLMSFYGYDIL